MLKENVSLPVAFKKRLMILSLSILKVDRLFDRQVSIVIFYLLSNSVLRSLKLWFELEFTRIASSVTFAGTEDVVRVYAEAATRQECDKLAAEVARKVHELAGGTGNPPEIPQ